MKKKYSVENLVKLKPHEPPRSVITAFIRYDRSREAVLFRTAHFYFFFQL